jgi:hypothetical protein
MDLGSIAVLYLLSQQGGGAKAGGSASQQITLTNGHHYLMASTADASVTQDSLDGYMATLGKEIPASTQSNLVDQSAENALDVEFDYTGPTKSFALEFTPGISTVILDKGPSHGAQPAPGPSPAPKPAPPPVHVVPVPAPPAPKQPVHVVPVPAPIPHPAPTPGVQTQNVSFTSGHRYQESVSQGSASDATFESWSSTYESHVPESYFTIVSQDTSTPGTTVLVYDYTGPDQSFALPIEAGITFDLQDMGPTPVAPPQPQPPPGPVPPTAPFPSGWEPFPDPIPSEVVARAVQLLSSLPIGQTKMESMSTPSSLSAVYSGPYLWVTYQGQAGGTPGSKNVVAWVVKGTLPSAQGGGGGQPAQGGGGDQQNVQPVSGARGTHLAGAGNVRSLRDWVARNGAAAAGRRR